MTIWAAATLAIATAGAVAIGPGYSQETPDAPVSDTGDRAVLVEAMQVMQESQPDIRKLDAVLAKLPRPTRLRGMVQIVRAAVLAQDQDMGPSVAAIDEAIRLLPDDPQPKLVATGIFTFSGAPQRAADLWMQASRESPELAWMVERYIMSALIGRLVDSGDHTRADKVSARMGEIGFESALASERSSSAVASVRQAIREERTQDAIAVVARVSDPSDLTTLYADRKYAALWPRIAEWAGADLSLQTRRYLEELRSDWTAAETFETAVPYARQLADLNAHAAVVGLFLPMFETLKSGGNHFDETQRHQADMEILAPIVSRSLANLGRQAESPALLTKVAAAMPVDDQGSALNIEGAFLSLAMLQMDWPQVASRADIFLTRAKAFGPGINRSATLAVEARKACALSRIGRQEQAQAAALPVLASETDLPEMVMTMHVCRGDAAAGRALLIARLADERTRDWALGFLNDRSEDVATPYGHATEPVEKAIRTAPDVVAAAQRVGRVLPKPAVDGLPAGFEPFRAPLGAKPLDPDSI